MKKSKFFQKFQILSKQQFLPLDGELLYSKNNVCVHPIGLSSGSTFHYSGFLAVVAKVKCNCVSLVLDWSPSIKLNKNDNNTLISDDITCNKNKSFESKTTAHGSFICSNVSPNNEKIIERNSTKLMHKDSNETNKTKLFKSTIDSKCLENIIKLKIDNKEYQGHVVRSTKEHAYAPFCVDVGLMRSVRIYFRNDALTNGELIIASCDSQFKVLHFHNGGLDRVASILNEYHDLATFKAKEYNTVLNQFSVVFPNLSAKELHPEEGLYQCLTAEKWSLSVDEFGRIQDSQNIQKAIFFGGVQKELRPAVWPFLLKFYCYESTCLERSTLQQKQMMAYKKIDDERLQIFNSANIEDFWRNIACSIEKDVLRTDRANPFFKGDGNPNLSTLQHILLNYSIYTKTAYTQGMSDLLSPILMEIQEESNVFWCFVGLMRQTIFISSPSNAEMEKQLFYLTELIQLLLPNFYAHLLACGPDSLELLFAHRWILLCFKREFSEAEALKIWEACWANYQTIYFHLFVCVSIMSLYGSDVVEKQLASDEMLLHFSNLALQMNGILVLKKARGMLHQIFTSNHLPCTLHDLFNVQPNDFCTKQQYPVVVCTNTQDCQGSCRYGGKKLQHYENIPKIFKLFFSA